MYGVHPRCVAHLMLRNGMKVVFSIPFATNWGDTILVCGDHPALGNGEEVKGLSLSFTGREDLWEGEVTFTENQACIHYNYIWKKANGELVREWGESREWSWKEATAKSVRLCEYWSSPRPEEKAWFSSAFSQVLNPRPPINPATPTSTPQVQQWVQFSINVPRIGHGFKVGLLGNSPELGSWQSGSLVPMTQQRAIQWSVKVPLADLSALEYKYVIYREDTLEVVEWEAGINRVPPSASAEATEEIIYIGDSIFHYSSRWKGAGVAFPVFSLRSNRSMGVGEFEDLLPVIDWAKKTGMHLIQVLPINDTIATYSWKDSYPYAAISVFALHPMYANIQAVASYYGEELPGSYMTTKAYLNSLEEVDVVAVIRAKLDYFKDLYDRHKESLWKEAVFHEFLAVNGTWVKPYAIFSHLRDTYQSADFQSWPSYSTFGEAVLSEFFPENGPTPEGVGLYLFIQYHLDKQLSQVATYAREQGVVLKGDIPIGIYRYSVDAWTDPHLFNMEGQAGAPPDFFSAGGQNWGFPTYKWEVMALDGYAWWRQRLQKMASFFDAYRIDHVLGFFRIWEIPYPFIEGALGYFNPALPFSPQEIWDRKVPFEKDRYTLPFLRGHVLDQRVPDSLRSFVEDTFLQQDYPGYYRFLPDYTSQRAIQTRLDEETSLSEKDKDTIRRVLFTLMHEVIFIQDPHRGGEAYHPRFLIDQTQSFQELDGWVQDRILELYTDYFFNRHEEFWREQGMTKLPAILEATDMLVCAEDLGMVPACVPPVLEELGILGLEIQRMPKDNTFEFNSGSHNPYLSVFSTSSHDISPLRAWWEEDRGRTQRYYNQVLNLPGEAPETCETWVVEAVLKQHLHAPSMWAIFPIQDVLALDETLSHPNPQAEQINNPSNPDHYWRYRMHLSLEDLLKEEKFVHTLKELMHQSGRMMDY